MSGKQLQQQDLEKKYQQILESLFQGLGMSREMVQEHAQQAYFQGLPVRRRLVMKLAAAHPNSEAWNDPESLRSVLEETERIALAPGGIDFALLAPFVGVFEERVRELAR